MTREREIDDRIADWVDGRLGGKDRERFEAELRVNPQLRRDLEAYERTVASVRAALRAETQPVQLADRVLAAIASGQRPAAPPARVLRWRPVLWSLATAAALLALTVLVDAWFGTPPTKVTQTAAHDRPEQQLREVPEVLESRSPPSPDPREDTAGLDRMLGAKRSDEPGADAATGAGQARLRVEPDAVDRREGADGGVPAKDVQNDRHGAPRRTDGPAGPGGPAGSGPGGPVPGSGPGGRSAGGPGAAGPGAGTLEPGAKGEALFRGGVPKAPPTPAERAPAEGVRAQPLEPQDEAASAPGAVAREGAEGELFEGEGKVAVVRAEEESADAMPPDGGYELRLAERTVDADPAAGEADGAPLPLVVVQGRAPATKEVWSQRRRQTATEGAERGDKAGGVLPLAARVDEFLIAQVAELASADRSHGGPGNDGERRGTRTRRTDAPATAADAWVHLGALRLRRLGAPRAPATPPADGTGDDWREQDWLVEGRKEDVAVVLQRVAAFAEDFRLALRSSETRRVRAVELPAVDTASTTAAADESADPAPTRIVLRLRLQAR